MDNKEKTFLFSLTAKDFKFEFFAAASKGGQAANRRHSNCRCVHIESGAVGISKDERSQSQNKELAFLRCVQSEKFKIWHKANCARRLNKKLEEENLCWLADRKTEVIMQKEMK